MYELNTYTALGRTTKPVTYKHLDSGTFVGESSLAIPRSYKTTSGEWKEDTFFVDFQYFAGKKEEYLPEIGKGVKVFVSGYLKQDRWEHEGKKYSKVVLIATNLEKISEVKKKTISPTQEVPEEADPLFG